MPITVLNPTSHSQTEPLRLALPIASLEGRLVGVLDNGKVNSDRLFRYAEAILREQHGVRELLWRRKQNFSQPEPATMLAELSACDAIITGIGD